VSRYALDADILGMVQRAGHAKTLTRLGRLPVVVTDTVWDELTIMAENTGKVRPETLVEMKELLVAIADAPTLLEPATPESDAYVRLHPGSDTENAGEHSLIAYATQHPDVTAVLFDRKALHRAVEELRGRVLSIHGFLDVLRTQHGLSAPDAEALSQRICAAKSLVQPLWWRPS
jgi:hypothetical protein